MFGFQRSKGSTSILAVLGRSLAVIEFTPDGKIQSANENFCKLLDYQLSDIVGQHHTMLFDKSDAVSPDYQALWARLGRGEVEKVQSKYIGKGGREIWLLASYHPITIQKGSVTRIVVQVTDVSESKIDAAEKNGLLEAISRAQAVIEFTPAGDVMTANVNFLNLLGYRMDEVKGQHHRLFMDAGEAQTPAYREFWARLNAGEYIAQEFKRIGKGGKEIWIQASYNPVFDERRKVKKVVKFATDVTDRVRAVNDIAAGLVKLAANQVNHRISDEFSPAFEPLRLDFNASLEKLQAALTEIAGTINAIAHGTNEISQASDDLSRRTEQQAASLEETAAALDEITATVRKTALGAKHAHDVVGSAKSNAEQSGQVVRQAVGAMSEIEKSSQKITQIIGVIDEIAFQTNLLALNAGVEAARAGDAGRGFAVVASEVRALAQRSAEAAKEIKTLISTSSHQVEQGVAFVGQTGEALVRIVAEVNELNAIVSEISSSTQEQATALDEVNTAVNQMDQVTQQNAAMVEQSTAATQALAQETAHLTSLIGQFQVDEKANGSAERRPRQTMLQPRAVSTPVRALRVVGRSGAAPKRQAEPEGWTEF